MSQSFQQHPRETSHYKSQSDRHLFLATSRESDSILNRSTVDWKYSSHDHIISQNTQEYLDRADQINRQPNKDHKQYYKTTPLLQHNQANAPLTSSSLYSYRVFYKTKESDLGYRKQPHPFETSGRANQASVNIFYLKPENSDIFSAKATNLHPLYNRKPTSPDRTGDNRNRLSNRLDHCTPSQQLNHINSYHLQPYCPMSASPSKLSKPGPNLIWLLFMHRHGDRAPLNMAPRDKYNNITYWPEGFGNLNNAGRLRMFMLGKFIRRRYDGFLTDNMREVYSRSSDVDRCIESSHAVLAGLYPPSSQFEWNKDLLWTPAPVHTVPAPEDYLLNEAGRKFLKDCVQEIHKIQASDAVKKLYEDSVNERALLEREIGYDYDMFYKFKCTYSTLDIEERSGLEMPDWYTPELKQKLYRFAGIAFGLAGGGTEKLKKIRCGHLLDDIVTRMTLTPIEEPVPVTHSDFQQPTNAPSEDSRRVVHYSTHDSIMAAFLESLNVNTPMPVPPGFGATFFIELYVDSDENGHQIGEKYVKLFYLDDTYSENPVEKKLPGCVLNDKGQLTLENFKSYVAHLLPSKTLDTQA